MRKTQGMRHFAIAVSLLTCISGCNNSCPVPRNPFGFEDPAEVPRVDPVTIGARTSKLGSSSDQNSEAWPPLASPGKTESLNGRWFVRWARGSGTATVREKDGRVYARYTETEGSDVGNTYLLEAAKSGALLHGTLSNVKSVEDTEEFVGVIVSAERIDGSVGTRRWDLRRIIDPSAPLDGPMGRRSSR